MKIISKSSDAIKTKPNTALEQMEEERRREDSSLCSGHCFGQNQLRNERTELDYEDFHSLL